MVLQKKAIAVSGVVCLDIVHQVGAGVFWAFLDKHAQAILKTGTTVSSRYALHSIQKCHLLQSRRIMLASGCLIISYHVLLSIASFHAFAAQAPLRHSEADAVHARWQTLQAFKQATM